MNTKRVLLGVLACTAVLAPLQAKCSVLLPDASMLVTVVNSNSTGQNQSGDGSTPITNTVTTGGVSATGTATLTSSPTVTGSASALQNAGNATVDSTIFYSLEIVGPLSGAHVPVTVATSGLVTAPIVGANV